MSELVLQGGEKHMDYDAVLAKRRQHIGPNTTLVYKHPLHMVCPLPDEVTWG